MKKSSESRSQLTMKFLRKRKWPDCSNNKFSIKLESSYLQKIKHKNIVLLFRKSMMISKRMCFLHYLFIQLSSTWERTLNGEPLRLQKRSTTLEWWRWLRKSSKLNSSLRIVVTRRRSSNTSSLYRKDRWFARIWVWASYFSSCYFTWRWTSKRRYFLTSIINEISS